MTDIDIFAACNPAIEQCEAGDSLLRPATTHLVYLLLVYYTNLLQFPFSVFITIFLGDRLGIDDSFGGGGTASAGYGYFIIFVWALMYFWQVLVWAFPAWTLTSYLVFGSNFFLFRWTDDLAVYFIASGTSSLSFFTHVGTTAILLFLGLNWGTGAFFAFNYGVISYLLETLAWDFGVNAVRRVDP